MPARPRPARVRRSDARYRPFQTCDDLLRWASQKLRQGVGPVRLLFYLAAPPPEIEPLYLLPCPARPLAAETFVYEKLNQADVFSLTTDQPAYAPLAVPAGMFGYLFLETQDGQPLSAAGQALLAQAAAQTARHLHYLSQTGQIEAQALEQPPPIVIDPRRRRVWIEGKLLSVTAREVTLLQLLYEQPGQLCRRDIIQAGVYGAEKLSADLDEDRLDKLVFRLRVKLKQVAGRRVYLQTVRGFGYRLLLSDR